MSAYIYTPTSTLPTIGCLALTLARTGSSRQEEEEMYARNDSSIAQAILANEGPDAYEAYIRSMDSYWRSMDAKREAKRARQAARKEFLLRKKERLEEFLVLAKFAKLAVAGKLGFTSALL